MNVNEVPQDPRNIKQGDTVRKKMYAVGQDGKYTGVNSVGWDAENVALKQAWDDIDESLAETEKQVRAGMLSPIPYFMQKNLMDSALLSRYMGKWQWQVKRHFKTGVFKKLDNGVLAKYATIFNITTDELINFGKEIEVNS